MSQENIVIDPMIRQLMESPAMWLAAKEFMASEFGKHIASKASEEIDEALAQMIDADPEDAKAIRELQTKIKVAQTAVSWLMDTIGEGENAMRALDES